ncbi:WD40 repeat domain-containing protein [Enterovibrio sp. ZSDZ35]|uniref:WD40 repeat domain-containing protein n=1 Tax=Enterovibrio qingdaonensis TaxID=2899818 RepID=A0ABT5QJA8_9GAMM|nr:WD40 repeat domain-containing protein [Enterovibrio sp. ZSDZ35]MDD1781076.1 WD40 repeat domain-containing protein [Enterovibrio sp. ZSDZ35]
MKKILFSLVFALSSYVNADEQRYVDGARWAFVSDAISPKLAVVDTFTQMHVDTLTLQAIPTELEVSDLQDLLVYIDGKSPTLFLYDLAKKSHGKMPLSFIPDQIVFHPDGAQLAVGGKNALVFVMPLDKKLMGTFDSVDSPFSLNFDNGGYNLYVTEQASGNTFVYRFHDGQRTQMQLGEGSVSEITLSPDSRLGMVAQYDDNTVYIRDLFMNTEFATVALPSTPYRPYVSSDSEHIILADEKGKGVVINAWSGEKVRDISVGENPGALRSGWLETIGIISSDSTLSVFDIAQSTPEKNVALSAPLKEVVVVSDSKTLFATQDKSSSLFVYDIRTATQLSRIDTGLAQPLHMVMGITNTICH